MTITADQFKDAARKAVAAGDMATARKLIARAQAAEGQPATAQPAAAPSAVPAQALPPNPEMQAYGPGPTGKINPELYDMGAIGRRFVPGQAPPPTRETVQAADGTEMVFNPSTGQYTSRELLANNMRPSTLDAIGAGSLQGMTMGAGDEAIGLVAGPFKREQVRAMTDAAERDRPLTTLAGEIGGVLSLPTGRAKTGALPAAMAAGATKGAVGGGIYGFNAGDGNVADRLAEGFKGAVAGAVIGATAPAIVNFGTKAWRAAFARSAKAPTIESLRMAKNAAYAAVDQAGEKFAGAETKALADNVKAALQGTNYVPGVDRQTDAVIQLLDGKAGQELTLGQLDKLRKNFFDRVATAKNETGIYEAIDAIDELIISRTSTSELLDAARLSNARYKKAELLDRAFQKAKDQTASTGSGGNILNKYRQTVTSIINDPKRARWFAESEIAAMRAFVEGTPSQNVLRLIGKLAPGGNGLMTALNLGAVSANPMALVGSAVASGAKAVSDGATERAAQGLIGMVAGKQAPIQRQPIRYPNALNRLGGPVGGQF
jgi:hypothetical protein